MRFVLAALLWLLTTIGLAVAVPAGWVQQNVVDADGYAAFAQRAAADPALQRAVAGEPARQTRGPAQRWPMRRRCRSASSATKAVSTPSAGTRR